MTNGGFKLKTWHIIVVGLILAIYLGYITIPGFQFGQQVTTKYPCPTCGQEFTSQALLNAHITSFHPGTPITPGGTHGAAQIQYSITDSIKGDVVSTTIQDTGVDILPAKNGVFDLLSFGENKTDTAFPDQSSNMYADGQALLIHAYSSANPTNGLDYYDQWYYVVLHDGNPIYNVGINNFVQASGSPHYTYTINTAGAPTTGSQVAFTSGTTNYWDCGKFSLIPRTSAAGLNFYITYSGTTQSSVTDGSTWVTGSSTANSTLTGDNEHLDLLMTQDNANTAWGASIIGVSSQGQAVEYCSVIIVTTNATAIDAAQFSAEGWVPLADNTLTAEKGWYKKVGPYFTTKGSLWTQSNLIPLYVSAVAVSTRCTVKVWVLDFQLPANVGIGATSITVPTAYGMVSRYGLGAMVQASAYSTSSNVGTGQQITAYPITAAT